MKLVVVSGDDYYTTTKQPLYIMWDLGTTFPVTEKDYFGYEGSTSDRYYVNTLFNNGFTFRLGTGDYSSSWFLTPLNYFESTFDWKLAQTTAIFKAYTEANKLDYTLEAGDKVPPFRQPGTLTPTNYTTIDLNKYAYVLLNLKARLNIHTKG